MKRKQPEIKALLPHRDPFLFVDNVVSFNAKEIVATKSFTENDEWLKGSFPESGIIPGMILVESMAQCGGAGIKLLGTVDGFFALTSIEEAQFFGAAAYDKTIKYVIQNLRISTGIIRQSGIALMNDTLLLKTTWMSVKVRQ